MTKEQNETFTYCRWYLENIVSAYIFNHDLKREMLNSLDTYTECIVKATNEEKMDNEFLDFLRSRLSTSLNVLKNVFFQTKMDENLKRFLKFYVNICFNINNNLFNDERIKSDCDFLQRACDNFLSFNETMTVFMESSRTLSQWKTFLPPSFRLSEHYYSLIREE